MGHLFLEKMFQISVGIPRLDIKRQQTYWEGLLRMENNLDHAAMDAKRQGVRSAAEHKLKEVVVAEEVVAFAKDAEERGEPEEARAIIEMGTVHLASRQASTALEHRLSRFADLLESNPRSMKRFVNAYGMNQAGLLLEGRGFDPDELARWTILEMRWPLVAEVFAQHPDRVQDVFDDVDLDVPDLTPETKALARHRELQRVVGINDHAGRPGLLGVEVIRAIVGGHVAAEQLAAKDATPPLPASTPPPAM